MLALVLSLPCLTAWALAHGAALLPLNQALRDLPPAIAIHTDGLHFEDAAGVVIADLVEGFLLRPA